MKLSVVLFVLQIVFLILKLCGIIFWNWALVLIPTMIWGAYVVLYIILLVISFKL